MDIELSDFECRRKPRLLKPLHIYSNKYVGNVCLVSTDINGAALHRYGQSSNGGRREVYLSGVFIGKELKPRFLLHRDNERVYYRSFTNQLLEWSPPVVDDFRFEEGPLCQVFMSGKKVDVRFWKL